MEFSVRWILADGWFNEFRDIESLCMSMTNANKLVIAGIENKNGTIYRCSLRPCLSKMSSQLYGSQDVWSVGYLLNDVLCGKVILVFVGWVGFIIGFDIGLLLSLSC